MPNRSGNGNMQGMRFQRVPSGGNRTNGAENREEPSPLNAVAKRIREEQGEAGFRDFLAAMEPFAAPNELKSMAGRYGIDYSEIVAKRNERRQREQAQGGFNQGAGMNGAGGFSGMNGFPGAGGFNPQLFQMMQMMQLMNGMNGFSQSAGAGGTKPPGGNKGTDLAQLMRMIQLLPLLQGMTGGSSQGAPDLSMLMKMMGG